MPAPAASTTQTTNQPSSSRERRRRHDGSEIDPVANLAEFLQGIPASDSEPAEEPDAATAPVPAPVQLQVPQGPTPEQIIAEERGKRETAERELERFRSQSQISETVRREVAQQTAPPPQAPPPDPRLAEIQEVWFTDPGRAQELLQAVNEDRTRQMLETERGKIKTEITSEQQQVQRREAGNVAFNEYRRRLLADGVSQADLDNHYKVGALYQAVTLPPTADRPNPYYTAGGPLSADVLVKAWKDLFAAPAPPPAPVPTAPSPPPPAPVIVAPPGSGRPAPAAEPPRKERAASVPQGEQRDRTYVAEIFGYKPENLIKRQRDRLEREKGNS